MTRMHAAIVRGPAMIDVEEMDRPEPGPDDVLVRVRQCGICGSDLHWWHGSMPSPAVTPGHEIAGEVAAVGRDVRGLREGDPVCLEGLATCGYCDACRSGDYNVCRKGKFVGLTSAGGLAEYVVTPARHAFRLPDGLDFATAALAEPLGVAVHAVRMGRLEIGQRVLVLGAGTIGLMAVAAARAGGAGEIVVAARRPHQREAARALGADRIVGEDEVGEAMRDTPADLVVETVGGSANTLYTALLACRPRGTISITGIFTGAVSIPATVMVAREITMVGSMCYARAGARADFDVVVDILRREGATIGSTCVTHRFPLTEVAQGFRTAADKSSGAIKVSIGA